MKHSMYYVLRGNNQSNIINLNYILVIDSTLRVFLSFLMIHTLVLRNDEKIFSNKQRKHEYMLIIKLYYINHVIR